MKQPAHDYLGHGQLPTSEQAETNGNKYLSVYIGMGSKAARAQYSTGHCLLIGKRKDLLRLIGLFYKKQYFCNKLVV